MVTVSQPDTLGYSDLTVIPITCQGEDDGSISITGSGGNPPYEYTLMPGSITNTTGLFDSLSPGSYTIEVDGSGSCPVYTTDAITFTDPPLLSFDSTNHTIISCQGANDGSIEFFAKGGVSPISYSIDTGNNYSFLDVFSGLSPARCNTSDDLQISPLRGIPVQYEAAAFADAFTLLIFPSPCLVGCRSHPELRWRWPAFLCHPDGRQPYYA